MKNKQQFTLLIIFFTFLASNINILGIDNSPVKTEESKENSLPGKQLNEINPGHISVTYHTVIINKQPLKYRAETGYMPILDGKGKAIASIFFISYTVQETKRNSERPITFAFNGGPGSSSTWVHLGGIGPKRVLLSEEGFPYPPPFKYIDNENTWLQFTDLVFIDPVSTGYSRPAQDVDKKIFHGSMEDVESVGEFIRLYVSKFHRWPSPKYICGASYGVERATRLAQYLQDRYMMYIRGLVLMVGGLNWILPQFSPGNDMSYVLYLPSYTATAWYYKKLPDSYQKDFNATMKEVQQWSISHYLPALAKGDTITETEKNRIINQLSQYTGLNKTFIQNKNFKINNFEFRDELLREEKQTFGLYDCRYTIDKSHLPGDLSTPSMSEFLSDPALAPICGPLAAAMNHYIRTELMYVNDLPYEVFAMDVYPWNWGEVEKNYLNVMKPLYQAMTKNKYLHIFFANGYYDLVVPYFAIPYVVSHLGLPGPLRENIIIKSYFSGHFMYGHPNTAIKLKEDIYNFYSGASNR